MIEAELIPPPELKGDEYLDFKDDSIDKIISFFPKLWAPEYNNEFRMYARGAIQRGEEEIKNNFGPLRKANQDIILTLKRVQEGNVYLRGDYRYPSDDLARYLLETKFDLLPPIIGASGMGNHLLDGHHRWRAYILAGLKPLILEVKVEPSKSITPKIIGIVDPSAMKKN